MERYPELGSSNSLAGERAGGFPSSSVLSMLLTSRNSYLADKDLIKPNYCKLELDKFTFKCAIYFSTKENTKQLPWVMADFSITGNFLNISFCATVDAIQI